MFESVMAGLLAGLGAAAITASAGLVWRGLRKPRQVKPFAFWIDMS